MGLGRPTTLAHITDAHVTKFGRRTAVLKDLTIPILDDLIEQFLERQVDGALFGGDNIDNHGDGAGDLDAFLGLADRFDRWLCTVGNHESANAMRGPGRLSKDQFIERVEGHGPRLERSSWSEVIGDVRVIGLDTTLTGTHGGFVTPRAMDFLARELRMADEPHIVVLGHHLLAAPWAPYQLDAWNAEYLVANRGDVISLLSTCPRVRAYLCGHHHASRIHRIAGRGDSSGFYHILSPSPAAFPHGARLLTFEDEQMTVETLKPRIVGITEAGREAVMGGRKAQRFATLGWTRTFTEYVEGRTSDNEAVLRYDAPATSSRPQSALDERRVS